MKETQEFLISEEELDSYGNEILKWGESRGLEPAQLCLILLLMHDWLKDELGIEIKEQIKLDIPPADGVH